jgi:aminoglycoside/choline kinase family phosphotransferase
VTDCEAVFYDLIGEPQVQRVARPTLLHADLHKRNIFVSDSESSKITGIIDWQSTSIEPAFIYANETPDFATLVDDMPKTERDGQDQAMQKKKQKDIQLCAEAFEVWMKGYVPAISQARAVDDTILRPFRYCNTSWRDSVVSTHLVRIS